MPTEVFCLRQATPSIIESWKRVVATKKAALTAKPSIYEEKIGVVAFSPPFQSCRFELVLCSPTLYLSKGKKGAPVDLGD